MGGKTVDIEMTRQQIFDGRDTISKVVGHRVKGKGKHSKTVEFNCIWDSRENDWSSPESLRKCHSGAPPELAEYVQQAGLLKNDLLKKKFCKWIKESIRPADLLKITNHRTEHG